MFDTEKWSAQRTLLAIALILALVQGCSSARTETAQTPSTQASTPSESPQPVVVVFFVDGLDHRRLNELLETDDLPNIKARFVDGGVAVKNAVASIPSVTYPNAVSLLTGCFPGHHGVLGNKWFDRKTFFLRDYSSLLTYQRVNDDFSNTTLYEYLDDKPTVNVRCNARRGVTKTFDHSLASGIDWAKGRYEKCDRRVGLNAPIVAHHAKQIGAWPSVYLSYMPGVDAIGHQQGSNTEEYRSALVVADEAIGRIIETVEQHNSDRPVYYVLVTDHSHVPTHPDQVADVETWLSEGEGLRVHQGAHEGIIQPLRKAHFQRFDAVLINGAYRRIEIHLKGEDGWHEHASRTSINRLIRSEQKGFCGGLPGILLASTRKNENAVLIHTPARTFRIDREIERGQKHYRVTKQRAKATHPTAPVDELLTGWADGTWRSSREWLARSAHTSLPDFVPQIVEYFDSSRAGDIVLFSKGEWSFHADGNGGHGSCLASDMRIPMFFSGPSLPKGAGINTARLVDVMPTILDMLNESHRLDDANPIDGISLLPKLRSALKAP
ncbi:MAG: hypothetical protein GXP29_01340 [Planctomycetes bacterium]|nr:hypothetical protein [Planctomycetota bacterium]